MTPEELYQTKCFKGLKYKKADSVYLGYREKYLSSFWGFRHDTSASFEFVDNHLSKVLINVPSYYYKRRKEDLVEPFISCCKKLYQIYGSPLNLRTKFRSNQLELDPYDKAIFQVGNKQIVLRVVDYKNVPGYVYYIGLCFSKESLVTKDDTIEGVVFDDNWFSEMRRKYKLSLPSQ
jgi:hypothetical protein